MKKPAGIVTIWCGVSVVVIAAITITVLRSAKEFEDAEASAMEEEEDNQIAKSKKFMKLLCGPTEFEQACEDNLKDANSTDPKELVKDSLEATITHLNAVLISIDDLNEFAGDNMTKQAIENCKELLGFSIQDLSRCSHTVKQYEANQMDGFLEDLDTWLSASLTFQDTCLDGFQNTTGEAGDKMRKALELSFELTENGIAMVEEMANMFEADNIKALAGRRLLGGDPSWMDAGARKLLVANITDLKPNVVVAKDGTGKYKTIKEALVEVPTNNNGSFVIYVKEGVYKEQVVFTGNMSNVVLVGDGPVKTRITGNLSYNDGVQTFKTPTVVVIGDNFIGKDIAFENSAGGAKGQAVALRSQSDKAVFFNCKIDGFQDTLHVIVHRQFYRDCSISGTIDFIFGNAAVVFQNCLMTVRKPPSIQNCTVTAQGRLNKREPTGFVLQNCTISGSPDLIKDRDKHKVYLGRPQKSHSRTVIIQSQIDDIIDPAGWTAQNFVQTSWFGEHSNRGGGASTDYRVGWKGYKALTTHHAEDFTAHKFFIGDDWVPLTGVPYVGGWMVI